METGIYVALSKEIGVLRDMEVTSNNLANVTTTGYDDEKLLFNHYLIDGNKEEGKVAYANDVATYRDTSQGDLKTTGSALDAAIVTPNAYFTVQTPLGTRYTRNGNFTKNGNGDMVTSEGYPVMDETGQPITFDQNDRKIEIRDDGTVNVDGADRGKLRIVSFANEQLLEKTGSNLYRTSATPRVADNVQVLSGVLESSNVKPVLALTHLMLVSKAASDVNNYINTVHALARKASDTLSKVY